MSIKLPLWHAFHGNHGTDVFQLGENCGSSQDPQLEEGLEDVETKSGSWSTCFLLATSSEI